MKPITKGGQILSNRRKGAIARLEAQLSLGLKQTKGNFMASTKVPLTDSDITRIKKEISTLKGRV